MKPKTTRYAGRQLKAMRKAGKSRTDWARVKSTTDRNIDFTDSPEVTPEAFASAVARSGLKPPTRKAQLTLRLDSDVLKWFKAQGRGYQTRINALLRAYKNAHVKVP